jgi:hypothetical protein
MKSELIEAVWNGHYDVKDNLKSCRISKQV